MLGIAHDRPCFVYLASLLNRTETAVVALVSNQWSQQFQVQQTNSLCKLTHEQRQLLVKPYRNRRLILHSKPSKLERQLNSIKRFCSRLVENALNIHYKDRCVLFVQENNQFVSRIICGHTL
jgi:hypothetical protein